MKQPKALAPLFLTETWERFGFYIIQALLVLYLTLQLHMNDDKAYTIIGEYSALIYISPLLGGWFADRILGFRYSILVGAVFLFIGYCIVTTLNHSLFFWGLAFVILGNGFLKPNISSFLGCFYHKYDERREGGFTFFYMGINIGSTMATLGSGFVQQRFGWSAAFGMAAIGMFIGTCTYCWGMRSRYENQGLPVKVKALFLKCLANPIGFLILCAITVTIAYLFLIHTGYANYILLAAGIIILVTLLTIASRYDAVSRNKMFALIILIIISIVFWSLFFQMFFAINLFTERNVHRYILGLHIPAVAFLSLEPIYILILGAPLAKLWQYLHRKKLNPSLGIKFSFAIFSIAVGMLILAFAIHSSTQGQKIDPYWLFLFFLFITMGDLLLSPIGLAMITELSPPRLVGMMMGVWFMAFGFGSALTGILARLASIPKHDIGLMQSNPIYMHAFMDYAWIAAIAGAVTLALSPWLKKLINYHSYKQ